MAIHTPRGLTDYFKTRTSYVNLYNLTDKTLIALY